MTQLVRVLMSLGLAGQALTGWTQVQVEGQQSWHEQRSIPAFLQEANHYSQQQIHMQWQRPWHNWSIDITAAAAYNHDDNHQQSWSLTPSSLYRAWQLDTSSIQAGIMTLDWSMGLSFSPSNVWPTVEESIRTQPDDGALGFSLNHYGEHTTDMACLRAVQWWQHQTAEPRTDALDWINDGTCALRQTWYGDQWDGQWSAAVIANDDDWRGKLGMGYRYVWGDAWVFVAESSIQTDVDQPSLTTGGLTTQSRPHAWQSLLSAQWTASWHLDVLLEWYQDQTGIGQDTWLHALDLVQQNRALTPALSHLASSPNPYQDYVVLRLTQTLPDDWDDWQISGLWLSPTHTDETLWRIDIQWQHTHWQAGLKHEQVKGSDRDIFAYHPQTQQTLLWARYYF